MPANRDHRSAERPDSGDAGGGTRRAEDGSRALSPSVFRLPTASAPWGGRQMWLRGLLILALALPPAAGLLSDASAAHAPAVRSTAPRSPRPMPKQRHAIKTVFLILMENHNWSDIKGNPSASYINRTLLPRASHAEQYYNPPGNHPSLPNYLWLRSEEH